MDGGAGNGGRRMSTDMAENARVRDPSVGLIIDGSSGDAKLESDMAALLAELFALFKRKQASYGPRNIAQFGEGGCVVRANDKLQRLIRLVWEGEKNPLHDETIEDTYIDLADYALIATLVRRGQWPGGEQ